MDNREEGSSFSFADLFKLIKHAIPTIIVCIVVCLMVGVSLCGAVFAINKNKGEATRAIFEISYKGADIGDSPKGTPLNVQDIAAIDKISAALSRNEMKYSPAEVRNALDITSHYSADIRAVLSAIGGDEKKLIELLGAKSLYPTQFVATLNHKAVSNMTRADAQVFLDTLLSIARTTLFSYDTNYDFMSAEGYTQQKFNEYEYLEKVSVVSLELLKLEYHVSDMIAVAANSKDDAVVRELKGLDSFRMSLKAKVATFETFVTNNGIAVDKDNTIALIAAEIEKLTSEVSVIAAEMTDIKAAIDAFKLQFNIVTDQAGNIINGGGYFIAVYEKMYDNYLSLIKTKSRLDGQIKVLQVKKDKYSNALQQPSSNEGTKVEANEMFDKILVDIAALTTKVAKTSDDYYEGINSRSMTTNLSASIVYDSPVKINWVLCIVVSCAVGILLGLATYPLIKNLKSKRANKAATPPSAEAE